MKKEISLFLTAVMFFTRLPVPRSLGYSESLLNQSSRYFPLVGTVVGAAAALVFWLAAFVFPLPIAVLLSMLTSILITGGFHEDGLADVCDGFGGGWTTERILEIMKDSRIGAFGAIGLMMVLLLKYASLAALPVPLLPGLLIAGHAASRWVAITFLYSHAYVRDVGKSKPVATQMSLANLIFASVIGLLPLVFFMNAWVFLLLIPLGLVKWLLGRYFKRWIGGYTGDCLGATQQVLEVVFYLSAIILWKYI
ncbi:MAG: adenosylcobinamide-GDP ribazoletransferase [Bacteroidota bacterium]